MRIEFHPWMNLIPSFDVHPDSIHIAIFYISPSRQPVLIFLSIIYCSVIQGVAFLLFSLELFGTKAGNVCFIVFYRAYLGLTIPSLTDSGCISKSSMHLALSHKSRNKGKTSPDRSTRATLVLTVPGFTTESST